MMLSLANFLILLVGMQPVSATSFNEPTSEEQKVAYMDNMERNYKPFPYSVLSVLKKMRVLVCLAR